MFSQTMEGAQNPLSSSRASTEGSPADVPEHVQVLMEDARRQPKLAQQLALDAARLLSATQERLEEHKDSGFFRRCWSRISGKSGELARATQADLVEMQKFAWHYLGALQSQNLLQIETMAVIRTELLRLARSHHGMQLQVLSLIERFDARLGRMEECAAILDWLSSVGVSGYGEYPRHLRLLKVVHDYYQVLQARGVPYESIAGRKDLEVAFREVDIDYESSVTVESFTAGLLEELVLEGHARFEGILQADRNFDPTWVLEHAAGAGYRAVCQVAVAYPHAERIARVLTTEADRRKVLIDGVLQGVTNRDAEYPLVDLARQILAGLLLLGGAIDGEEIESIDSAAAAEPAAGAPPLPLSVDQLMSAHVDVDHHSLLREEMSADERRAYLDSLALPLLATQSFTEAQRRYLGAIGRKLGDGECVARVAGLIASHVAIPIQRALAFLDTSHRKYIWLTDATFLASQDEANIDAALAANRQFADAMKLRQEEACKFMDQVARLSRVVEQPEIVKVVLDMQGTCDQWKTILDFRRLSLRGAFTSLCRELTSYTFRTVKTSFAIGDDRMKLIGCMAIGDEGFIRKSWVAAGRSVRVSEFKKLKAQVEADIKTTDTGVNRACSTLRAFGMPVPDRNYSLYKASPDENTSYENEEWIQKMDQAYGELSNCATGHSDFVAACADSLERIEAGKWPAI